MITVVCPACGTPSVVPDSAAGCRGKCRTCLAVVRVPRSAMPDDGGGPASDFFSTVDDGRSVPQTAHRRGESVRPAGATVSLVKPAMAASSRPSQAGPAKRTPVPLTTVPAKSSSSTGSGALGSLLFILLVVGGAVASVWWLGWGRVQQTTHILALKDQADALAAAGQDDEAVSKYRQFFAAAGDDSGQRGIDANTVHSARASYDWITSKTAVEQIQQDEAVRAAAAKVRAEAERQRTETQRRVAEADAITAGNTRRDREQQAAARAADAARSQAREREAAAESLTKRGIALLQGDGVPRDDVAGVACLHAAADAGNATALFELGNAYSLGRGTPTDAPGAADLWRRAAQLGNTGAMLALSHSYRDGVGMSKDPARQVALLQQLAARDDPDGTNELGFCYVNGQGVSCDDREAFRLFRHAADLRSATAMSNLFLMYAKGRGVAKDPDEAGRWLEKAADAGLPDAMWTLGNAYATGNDAVAVPKDLPTARAWILRAARARSPQAAGLVDRWASVRRAAGDHAARFLARLTQIESDVDRVPINQSMRFISNQTGLADIDLLDGIIALDVNTVRIDDDILNLIKVSGDISTMSKNIAKLGDLTVLATSEAERDVYASQARDAIKIKADFVPILQAIISRLHDETIPPDFPKTSNSSHP
jgi:TPR repeat protein